MPKYQYLYFSTNLYLTFTQRSHKNTEISIFLQPITKFYHLLIFVKHYSTYYLFYYF